MVHTGPIPLLTLVVRVGPLSLWARSPSGPALLYLQTMGYYHLTGNLTDRLAFISLPCSLAAASSTEMRIVDMPSLTRPAQTEVSTRGCGVGKCA